MKKRQLIPLGLLILLILVGYFLKVQQDITVDTLRQKHLVLQVYIHQHPMIAPLIFMGIYTLSVCLIIPDSTLLTLFAGLSFSWPLALIYCVISETLGALIFFGAIRALGSSAEKSKYKMLNKMRDSFKKDTASYLLFLRISHIIPFWLISLGAAYFNAPLRTFAWTTFVGVIPLTYFLIQAGHALGSAIALHQPFRISSLFTLNTELAFIALGLITLIPILIKKWKS